jgi:hypothetical protein
MSYNKTADPIIKTARGPLIKDREEMREFGLFGWGWDEFLFEILGMRFREGVLTYFHRK